MSRTGLAAEVPTFDLCREMRRIPALKLAFADATLVHIGYSLLGDETTWQIEPKRKDGKGFPAPTVREMLRYIQATWAWSINRMSDSSMRITINRQHVEDWSGHDITDPDALARACIEASKAGA